MAHPRRGGLETLVTSAARILNHSRERVDGDGKTRDDYEQDMRLLLVTLDGRPEAYVGRSVWNKVSKIQRDRRRRAELRSLYFPSWSPPQTPDEAADRREARLEEKSCVRLLETRLSRADRLVLEAFADSTGKPTIFWEARKRARTMLEEPHV